jgi:hypothetical protein
MVVCQHFCPEVGNQSIKRLQDRKFFPK